MRFDDVAVRALVGSLSKGRPSMRLVSDVCRCDSPDVSMVVPFLSSDLEDVRRAAVTVVGKKGDADLLVGVVKSEKVRSLMFLELRLLGARGRKIEDLVFLLESRDTTVKGEAVSMFKSAGRQDLLMSVLFDADEGFAEQARRYMASDATAGQQERW